MTHHLSHYVATVSSSELNHQGWFLACSYPVNEIGSSAEYPDNSGESANENTVKE